MALSEPWTGVIDGMEVDMAYDETGRFFSGTVKNVLGFELENVLVEIKLKEGEPTVVELGPEPLGNMLPEQSASFQINVDDEPEAQGLTFDGWQVHMEADNAPDMGNLGEEVAQLIAEGLTLDEPFIEEIYGVRTKLAYDDAQKAFVGTVTNITGEDLQDVRTEIHLDNGSELGPTPRITLKAGETQDIILDASGETEAFSIYVAHTEVSGTEHEGESGGSEESGNEHGENGGDEEEGEHGAGSEKEGEHGEGGEE